MEVKLLGHTQLSEEFRNELNSDYNFNDGQAISLSAIRTCYSPNHPSEIIAKEGEKYFTNEASDGEGGNDADRLFRHIFKSKHTSTVEHLNFTFSIEGVSRSLLAQLTRHRHFSYSVQSQRYVGFASGNKSGGFDYVVPDTIKNPAKTLDYYESYTKWEGLKKDTTALEIFEDVMNVLQRAYDDLRKAGIPSEDARAVLPNASSTNLVFTGNLRGLLDFYSKRKKGRGGQAEICHLSELLRAEVEKVEPWTSQFFDIV